MIFILELLESETMFAMFHRSIPRSVRGVWQIVLN
jgi:hypothetical protein